MGNFGQAVTSLLDAYSRCLALLKGSRLDSEGPPSEAPVQLASSLRSDRASIHRTYSSRLSQNGARFDKGDAAARSSLRRVIKRLTAVLADVVRTLSRRQPHSVDYDSLISLSRVSSVDAIRTINDLASRVRSEAGSRRSVESSRGRPTSRSHHHRHSQRDDGMRNSKSGSASWSAPTRHRQPQRQNSAPKGFKDSRSSTSSRSSKKVRRQRGEARENRVSMLTMSSDSTKLGEIRRRHSRLGMEPVSRVMYPLYPYRPEVKDKKKWWGLFGALAFQSCELDSEDEADGDARDDTVAVRGTVYSD